MSSASADDPPDVSASGKRVHAVRQSGRSPGQREGREQQQQHAKRQRIYPLQQEV